MGGLKRLKYYNTDRKILTSPQPVSFLRPEQSRQEGERFVPHPVRTLGVSNISRARLRVLCDKVSIKPSVVQNPLTQANDSDSAVRAFCIEEGIAYQGFFWW